MTEAGTSGYFFLELAITKAAVRAWYFYIIPCDQLPRTACLTEAEAEATDSYWLLGLDHKNYRDRLNQHHIPNIGLGNSINS